MWTSSAIPYICLFCHQQTHTVIFIFFSCTMHYTFQRLFLHCTFHVSLSFLIDHNQKHWSSKIFFCSFQIFENGYIHSVVSTLINVVKLDVENNNIVSTLSIVNWRCKFQRWHTQRCLNVDLTLSDATTSYHPSNNVETTLIGFLDIEECC